MYSYKVLKNCEVNDKSYEPGDLIMDKVLSKSLVEHWLIKGVIEKAKTQSKPKAKKED